MAEKQGILGQLVFGDWSQRATINRNAEELTNVSASVVELHRVVQQQSEEITRLRAMVMGLVEVLQQRAGIDTQHVEEAIQAAWEKLHPPPPPPPSSTVGDPYRGTTEPSPEDVQAAKALLKTAQDHHYSRRFADARAVYQDVVERYGTTKQAATAREQLVNLRNS